ncbi:MAG: SpoVR family protein [Deltaproteobacteria bacterium]|nr:SpoVR family protein [Deltaproteobacteria bacterium]
MSTALPPHLRDVQEEMKGHARSFGLDFFDTIFEVIGFDEMNMVASYDGFPVRYPHWKWGMQYERLAKSYEYGLSRIYELVINNDPSYAYLLESNQDVDQKLVMGHVYGHVDFFKNNFVFAHTNRKMMDEMANHATRVRKYVDRFGIDVVEAFVDRVLSIDNLIDVHSKYIVRRRAKKENDEPRAPRLRELPTDKEYMRHYINPPEYMKAQREKAEQEQRKPKRFPEETERDVLGFLMEHAPLERWQRDVLDMLREEAYYFAPQRQTKIMNEGWATYWHAKIMAEKACKPEELIDFADHHSGVVSMQGNQLNPYKLGLELFRNIEERWDKGQFGKEYDDCDDIAQRRRWDRQLGLGRQKIFEVRKFYTDVTFIDEFLTLEFVREARLFAFGFNKKRGRFEITSREFKEVKDKLLTQLTNFGQPNISVLDANHDNRGELLLRHQHDGVDLEPEYTKATLQALQAIWNRPVHVLTRSEGKGVMHGFDGKDHTERSAEYA